METSRVKWLQDRLSSLSQKKQTPKVLKETKDLEDLLEWEDMKKKTFGE